LRLSSSGALGLLLVLRSPGTARYARQVDKRDL
jgi:hypothetical protein